MKIRALASTCALTLAGLGAAVADPGPEAPEVKPQTAAGSSPEIGPGIHRVTLPADETKRYLKLSRPAAGENLVVSAYAMPGVEVEDDGLELALMLPDGETTCASDSDLRSTAGIDPLTGSVLLESKASKRSGGSTPDDACTSAKEFVLQLNRGTLGDDGIEGGRPLPVTLTFTREPTVDGKADQPAGTDDIKARPLPIKDDSEVEPGTTLGTAAPLGSDEGTKLEVKPGTTAYYKVRLGWNQRLDATAQVPANGSGFTTEKDLRVAFDIRGPLGRSVVAGGEGTASIIADLSSDPKQVTVFTAPVRWANRDSAVSSSGATDAVQWTTQPGWYVVALTVGPGYGDDLPEDPKPVPALLTVKTHGTPGAGPAFTVDGQQVAAPPAGQLSGEGDGTSILGLVVKIGLTVVVLAAVGAVFVWSRRRA